jgi:hypothetical protein
VKGYRLIYISLDHLIIERSVQFEEIFSHIPQQSYEDTSIIPPVRDDENAHVESSSDESYDLEELDDSESVQSDAESEHLDEFVEPYQRSKWAQTTLQDAGDLIGDPANTRRTRYDFEEPHVSITSIEPFPSRNLFLIQSLDPQSYGEAVGNPF